MDTPEFLRSRIGEAAALGTAACWAASACFFTAGTRHLPAQRVNQMRLLLACLLLQVTMLVRAALGVNDALPPPRQGLLLLASGFVGLTLGDVALFRAFALLDTRRVLLVAASAPVFVVLLGVPLLGERLNLPAAAGMALALGGIWWVLSERTAAAEPPRPSHDRPGTAAEGVFMAVLAAVGQAGGIVLAKAGLGQAPAGSVLGELAAGGEVPHAVSPLAGTSLRMIAGAGLFFLWAAGTGGLRGFLASWRVRPGAHYVVGGTIFGPFVGIWLSLVAVAHTDAAVAQTIMALQPVLILPVSRFVFREHVSVRAVLGAVVAVGGVALLTFRDRLPGI